MFKSYRYYCEVENCMNLQQRLGVCLHHKKEPRKIYQCEVDGCVRQIQKQRRCYKHLRLSDKFMIVDNEYSRQHINITLVMN